MSNLLRERALRARAQQARPARPAPQLGVRQSPLTIMQQQQQAQPTGNMFLDGAAGASPSQGNIFLGGQTAGRTQTQAQGGGGWAWGRGLGILINNPVTNTAIKPLQVLDYGRRAMVLGAETGVPFLDSGDDRSALDKMRDPTYGFGDIAPDTGMKWLDRGIGFVGDVALDPLTYLTFGAGKLGTAAGRGSAAHQLARKGFDDEGVALVGRLGVNAAHNVRHPVTGQSAREALGIGEAGLRFAGERIPGTRTFAEVTGEMLARGRARTMQGKAGDLVRRVRDPEEMAEAMQALATGRFAGTPFKNATQAAGRIGQVGAERLGQGAVRAKFGNDIQRFVLGMSPDDRLSTVPIVEAGGRSASADAVRQRFSGLYAAVEAAAQKFGFVLNRGNLGDNYVPHYWTPKGRAWLEGQQMDEATKRVFRVNDLNDSGRAAERKIKAGTYKINGQTVTFKTGSIEEINQVMAQVAPDVGKFVEGDMGVIMQRYLADIESDVGGLYGLAALREAGLVDTVAGASTPQVSKTLTERARKQEIARLEKRLGVSKRQQRDAVAAARQTYDQARRELHQRVGIDEQARMPFDLREETDRALRALDRVATMRRSPETAADVKRLTDELVEMVELTGTQLGDGSLDETVMLLSSAARQLESVERLGWSLDAQRALLREAKAGNSRVADVFDDMLSEGWRQIDNNLLAKGADGLAIRDELFQAAQRVSAEVRKGGVWRVLDEYTAFFKAYATMTPGFHMRNHLSATFMNYSDGVTTRTMLDALEVFRQLRKNPEGFLASASPELRLALEAVYASGAGGRWSPAALATETASTELVVNRLVNNRFTRTSNRMGEWVEGPIRLATAMDTIMVQRGTAQEALDRITRLHFDYSQLSNFDRYMRRFIPFWTFMSRNLPLQIQQMWQKPRAYAKYNSFVRNFRSDDPNDDPIPLWWQERGAFGLGFDAPWGDGNPLYAMPDLQHIGLQQDLNKGADIRRLLADANPMFRAPFETAIAEKKMFTGRPFREDENKWLYALEQLVPTIPQGQRLFGQSDYQSERRVQSILNWFGVPLRELTPGQLEAELRRLAAEGR